MSDDEKPKAKKSPSSISELKKNLNIGALKAASIANTSALSESLGKNSLAHEKLMKQLALPSARLHEQFSSAKQLASQLQSTYSASQRVLGAHSAMAVYRNSVLDDINSRYEHVNKILKSQASMRSVYQLMEFKHTAALRHNAPLWSAAIAAQQSLGFTSSVKAAVSGFRIHDELISSLARFRGEVKLSSIVDTLREESIYLGDYDLSAEQENETQLVDDQESSIFEEIYHRFQSVKFLPVKLFQKILDTPELMRGVSPRDFEYLVADLVDLLGFSDVEVTPRSGDGGRDIIATHNVNGIPLMFAFECKQYAEDRKIQVDTMRALLGTVSQAETQANMGVLVTTSSFTSGARRLIAAESRLGGKDFRDLVNWISEIQSTH